MGRRFEARTAAVGGKVIRWVEPLSGRELCMPGRDVEHTVGELVRIFKTIPHEECRSLLDWVLGVPVVPCALNSADG